MAILVLDFGSQYTQLIARRVRELGFYSEIRPCNVQPIEEDRNKFEALILSGGPASVTDKDAPEFDSSWLHLNIPVLGVCYGMQLITHIGAGKLGSGERREYGTMNLEVKNNSTLFKGFDTGKKLRVWMSHGDHVVVAPSGFSVLGLTESGAIGAIGNDSAKVYGVQFHPEVVHTNRGKEILSNFLKIADCKQDWNPASFVENTIEKIRSEIPENSNVVCGLSGGVDSTVSAVLVSKAIGDRLKCIFVDNGLLREEEGEKVIESLGQSGLMLDVRRVDARSRFITALKGVVEPEAKRKIIGKVFIDVFEEEAKKTAGVTHLVQGTLYPDVIESISVKGPSATIKSHHNVGGLPEVMNLKLIEPLRELFKDEVRNIGKELGIKDNLLWRQPFPGPGLAVRCLGEVNEEKLTLLRKADSIFVDEIRRGGLYKSLWQSFAVLLPVQSVGVMGDGRTYEMTIALRAVVSEDGMTADWAYLPEAILRQASSRIINEVRGINRVVYDISTKPPSTIEWE